VKVIPRGARVQVLASFLDLEHSFDAEMIVDVPSGRIEHAKAHMAKRPFQNLCLRALENIPRLEGEIIGRGIYRRITDLIGKSQGCVHLAEIFQAAVGFTATVLIVLRSGLTEDPRLMAAFHSLRRVMSTSSLSATPVLRRLAEVISAAMIL